MSSGETLPSLGGKQPTERLPQRKDLLSQVTVPGRRVGSGPPGRPTRCDLTTPVRSRSFWTGARAAAGSVCGRESPSCGSGRRRRGEGRGEGCCVLAMHTESGYGWPLLRARSLFIGAFLIPFPRFVSGHAGKRVPGLQLVCHGSAPTASEKGRAGAADGPGEPFSRTLVVSR